jgi:hypothetical protein
MKWILGLKRIYPDVSREALAKFLKEPSFIRVLWRNAGNLGKNYETLPLQVQMNLDSAEKPRTVLNLHGSKKSTKDSFEKISSNLMPRNPARSILEVGIKCDNLLTLQNMGVDCVLGASLRVLGSRYPNATIFSGDIDSRILFKEDRISTYWVNQLDTRSIVDLCKQSRNSFDLVIFDGINTPLADLKALILTMPFVRRDGYIVIEDISLNSAITVCAFFKLVLGHKGGSSMVRIDNRQLLLCQKGNRS